MRINIDPAVARKADDDRDLLRRIGSRHGVARRDRERGCAGGEMQKWSTMRQFHSFPSQAGGTTTPADDLTTLAHLDCCAAGFRPGLCRRWVKLGLPARSATCLL